MALARGGDHCSRFPVLSGCTDLFRVRYFALDLVVDGLGDMTHGEIIVLNGAIASDLACTA